MPSSFELSVVACILLSFSLFTITADPVLRSREMVWKPDTTTSSSTLLSASIFTTMAFVVVAAVSKAVIPTKVMLSV